MIIYPLKKLQVFYSNGIKLTLGNILRPYALRGPPFVKWNEIDSKVFHTLLMISKLLTIGTLYSEKENLLITENSC